MSSSRGPPGFPDLSAKLQTTAKPSAFEKQKAEAEAKRQREAAETAAVYEDFVKSFDHDDDDNRNDATAARPSPFPPRPPRQVPSGPGTSRRHFGTSALKSGPGSLGPPPSSFGKKRSFQDFSRSAERVLGFEDEGGSRPKVFDVSDDEDAGAVDRAEEKAIAKPTLRLSNLPPGTSPSMIKSLMPENLTVENVQILPPARTAGSERKCAVAIVTLSQETPANDLDGAVSTLQNRYLGFGYHLSLHRHLSSAAISSVALPNLATSSSSSNPFGAKPVEEPSAPNAPSQNTHRGFAPPTSYGPHSGINRSKLLHVPVKPPQDIRTIRTINKVIEGVLEHGPEFEALLMSRPEVQREEKWAWIWDARSQGGIWYRWRLWEIVTGSEGRGKGKFVPLFDGSHAWKCPDKRLPFEYTTKLDEFVTGSDYDSSDDEEPEEANQAAESEKTFLNPLEKAKLVHLLSRLPTSISKLRKGDIARVTTFAITHSSRGVEEVVDIIVSNVEKPFALTPAQGKKPGKDAQLGTDEAASEGPDTSAACLVGLYVINDILSSSSTSGVRHAWRFRQIFEVALRDRRVFERLGLIPEKLGWGRMRAEKWKRSIGLVLNLWEGWCVFPAESQAFFVSTFENPPSLKVEEKPDDGLKRGGKWKVVEASGGENRAGGVDAQAKPLPDGGADVDGEPIVDEDDVLGEPVDEDDVEGEPIDEDDVEGEPIEEDDVQGEPMDEDEVLQDPQGGPTSDGGNKGDASMEGGTGGRPSTEGAGATGRGQPRRRMRAVDMFADSDESDK
ncbi:hypothetical protein B0I35DRAFT_478103 [Stachybotrys elegans]|uniref:CID domain-containing protein n=1 Tax=Stachybotrys elegans TaxID=80388 RepID=A0A8K0STQ7_9HYPO|nr:hypothetical protein B0I35DRAFT_478103 [Stachybotrys elegans]